MQHTETTLIDVNKAFEHFNNDDYWKLIIEVRNWEQGPLAYDKDKSKGYLQSITRALLYNFLTIDSPLTLDLVIGLHDVAYHDKEQKSKLGLISDASDVFVGINPNEVTQDGLAQLIYQVSEDPLLSLQYMDKNTAHISESIPIKLNAPAKILANEIYDNLADEKWSGLALVRASTREEIVKVSEELIQGYNKVITNARGDEETILKAIAQFISRMHKYHPFEDGNGRTFMFLLLNKLLLQNHLSYSIIEIPGRFAAASIDELVKDIKEGQVRFKKLCVHTEAKDKPFLAALSEKVFGNSENFEKEKIGYLDVDVERVITTQLDDETFLNYINANLTNLYITKFVKLYSENTMDKILDKLPPQHGLEEILSAALDNANTYFFEALLQHTLRNTIPLQLDAKLSDGSTTILSYLLAHKQHDTVNDLLTILPDQAFIKLLETKAPQHNHYLNALAVLSPKAYKVAYKRLNKLDPDVAKTLTAQEKNLPLTNTLETMGLYASKNNEKEEKPTPPVGIKPTQS